CSMDGIFAERSSLEGHEEGWLAHKFDVRTILALKDLADEDKPTAFFAVAEAVADEASIERRGQFRSQIAYLVGVAEDDKFRLPLLNGLAKGLSVAIRRVLSQ